MAFDFPTAPSEGQLFQPSGGPLYKFTNGAWLVPTTPPVMTIADSAPSSPIPGQLWWESDTGNTFVWFDDGTSKQWIQFNVGGGLRDVADSQLYVRKNGAWVLAPGTAEARNRIVNGAMQISQENGTSGSTVNGFYAADQWSHAYSSSAGAAGFIQSAASVTPNGSGNRLRAMTSLADTSIAAGEYWLIAQRIEGLRVADLQWGTANAKQIVVRFGFRGPAGQYAIQIGNAATSTRSYVAPFTISAGQANTDTVQTFIIPGDTTGTWAKDTSIGLTFAVTLVSGSSFLGVTGWNAGQYFAVAGQFNGLGTVNNTFELFDVGLYLDAQATALPPPWQAPDYADELAACQRYFAGQLQYIIGTYSGSASSSLYSWVSWPVQMRANPTLAFTGLAYSNASNMRINASGSDGAQLIMTGSAAGQCWGLGNVIANARM